MTVSSADPGRLQDFVRGAAPARVSAEDAQRSVASLYASVYEACGDRRIDCDSLGALATALESMGGTERFVSTVRAELLAADPDVSGPVTVSDDAIAAALRAEGVGTPPVAVSFDPATMVGVPPTSGFVDDPICAASGNMVHQDTDLRFPAIAAALDVVRSWNSLRHDAPGAFGPGWSSVLDMALEVAGDTVRAHLGDGATVPFVADGGRWRPLGRRALRLQRADSGEGWVLRTDHLRHFLFDADGRLTGWRVGVARAAVARDGDGLIVGVHEHVTGRSLAVAWSGGHVGSLSADDGRRVAYERAPGGVLVAASAPAARVTYESDGTLLVAVRDADGVAAFVNEYDAAGRVLRQTSPFGRVSRYDYQPTGNTVVTGGDGVRQAMIHDRRGNLLAVIDGDGSAMRLTYDDADRAVRVVERDGATWTYEYDERDDLVRRVDPDGLEHRWAWDDDHRLVAETDRAGARTTMVFDTGHAAPSRVVGPDGATVSQRLDDRGLPVEIADADGVVTRFRWDRNGQLVAAEDALGNAVTFDRDDRGVLRRIRAPNGTATTLAHDDLGRVVRAARGDAESTYRYSLAGRVVGGTEPGDLAWSAAIGADGAMVAVADGTGATARFEHDEQGDVTRVVAPDGAVYASAYDDVGRHVSSTDAAGATFRKGYDIRGRLVSFVDAEGNARRRALDALGRTVTSTAPDGAVTTWTYHPNGEVATLSTPDGRVWTTEVDAVGRPVALVDPGGRRTEVAYTPGGRVRERRSPSGRTERFEYDAAGRLVAVVGTDGRRRRLRLDERGLPAEVVDGDGRSLFHWDDDRRLTGYRAPGRGWLAIERDAGGRPVRVTDPTGAVASFDWDERGLMGRAVDPAGVATAFARDARGRLARELGAAGGATAFAYGADGRLAEWVDPAGVVTRLSRDLNGAVVGLRHGDGSGWDRTLDARGRDTGRVGTDGVVHAQFGYDVAGRLSSAAVPGTDLETLLRWDDTDRLTAVTSSGGMSVVDRDDDGWVVAITDEQGRRVELERDAAGRVVAVRDGDGPAVAVPREPVTRDLAGRVTIGRDGTVYRYDDAGRLAEVLPDGAAPTAFEYGPHGLVATETGTSATRRFGYDPAGRVVSVTLDGTGTTTIEYDRAGRRALERRPDGSVVTYHWDTLDRLVAIDRDGPGGASWTDITYDALSRPVLAGGAAVGFDPVSGQVSRLGDRRLVTVGTATLEPATGAWHEPSWRRPAGGVPVDGLVVLAARVLDPDTHQFLSPDPLDPVAGTNGAASAYTYAWHDPVNGVDPSGLRTVGVEEYEAMRSREEQDRVGESWQAIKDDPWRTLAAAGVVAAGVGLVFVPGGQAVGAGILIGATVTRGIGFATASFSPVDVAVGGAFGAIPRASVRGAGETAAASVLSRGVPSLGSIVVAMATGGTVPAGATRQLDELAPSAATVRADHAPVPARAPARNPATEAASWHGRGACTGVGDWPRVVPPNGTTVHAGGPGVSGSFTPDAAAACVRHRATTPDQGLRVASCNGTYRPGRSALELTADVTAARSAAWASPQFGPGGLERYDTPAWEDVTTPVVRWLMR